jgi:hypothetical protein
MKHYLDFVSKSPMSWESELFRPDKPPAYVDETGVLIIKRESPSSSLPIRHRSYLALAASTLHLFEPRTFPAQVHLKYLQSAVIEIRKQISRDTFVLDDLLHSISRVFLAAVLQGEETSARSHLAAAIALVKLKHPVQGFNAIDPTVAAALKYGDLHLAIETIEPFTLALPFNPVDCDWRHYGRKQPSGGDNDLNKLTAMVVFSADSSNLPSVLKQAIRVFVNAILTLSTLWISTTPKRINVHDISHTGPAMAAPLLLTLNAQKQVGHNPQHRALSLIITLWVQLLLCCVNSSCFNDTPLKVSIKCNVVPVLGHHIQGKSAIEKREGLSERVITGLDTWNDMVFEARKWEEQPNDWMRLVDVVAVMERGEVVRMAPCMWRLIELREQRMNAVVMVDSL